MSWPTQSISGFQDSQGYKVRPSLKQTTTKNKIEKRKKGHTHTYTYTQIKEKETMNLKEQGMGMWEGFEGGKECGKCNYSIIKKIVLKNKIKSLKKPR